MVNNIFCADCLLYHSIEAKTERLNPQTCGFHQQMRFQIVSPRVKIIHQQRVHRVHRVQLTRMDMGILLLDNLAMANSAFWIFTKKYIYGKKQRRIFRRRR